MISNNKNNAKSPKEKLELVDKLAKRSITKREKQVNTRLESINSVLDQLKFKLNYRDLFIPLDHHVRTFSPKKKVHNSYRETLKIKETNSFSRNLSPNQTKSHISEKRSLPLSNTKLPNLPNLFNLTSVGQNKSPKNNNSAILHSTQILPKLKQNLSSPTLNLKNLNISQKLKIPDINSAYDSIMNSKEFKKYVPSIKRVRRNSTNSFTNSPNKNMPRVKIPEFSRDNERKKTRKEKNAAERNSLLNPLNSYRKNNKISIEKYQQKCMDILISKKISADALKESQHRFNEISALSNKNRHQKKKMISQNQDLIDRISRYVPQSLVDRLKEV